MTLQDSGHILETHEATDARTQLRRRWLSLGILHASCISEKGNRTMAKTLETMDEAVKNPKYSFKKTDQQPKKAMKHRYERRKIKEYLHLGDWLVEEIA
ncbi:MAG: hypothetical protein U1F65_08670 [Verrucomicrobiota bacterium]